MKTLKITKLTFLFICISLVCYGQVPNGKDNACFQRMNPACVEYEERQAAAVFTLQGAVSLLSLSQDEIAFKAEGLKFDVEDNIEAIDVLGFTLDDLETGFKESAAKIDSIDSVNGVQSGAIASLETSNLSDWTIASITDSSVEYVIDYSNSSMEYKVIGTTFFLSYQVIITKVIKTQGNFRFTLPLQFIVESNRRDLVNMTNGNDDESAICEVFSGSNRISLRRQDRLKFPDTIGKIEFFGQLTFEIQS